MGLLTNNFLKNSFLYMSLAKISTFIEVEIF